MWITSMDSYSNSACMLSKLSRMAARPALVPPSMAYSGFTSSAWGAKPCMAASRSPLAKSA